MSIKLRLIILNFLQFFLWGSWLISVGGYMFKTLHFTGPQIGSVYAAMGLTSLFMPALLGIVADRFMNAERVYGLCHIVGAVTLFLAATVTDYHTLYAIMFVNLMAYMPTIALMNTVSYRVLEQAGYDIVRDFPPIRVWGTIGFIVAMWFVDLNHWTFTSYQFYLAAASALVLGIYSFTMPACPPSEAKEKRTLAAAFGLDAFVLFKEPKMLTFFIFAMLLGAALQITNAFGTTFLSSFSETYKGSFGVEHPNVLLSISQISETLFILTIPFFLRRFGIKMVMLFSMLAWMFRFGLFAIGNPGPGLFLLILSMIVYGMAFDFFNISGSLFVEKEADPTIRASAQGVFMLMTNGVGATVGGYASGLVVEHFTVGGVSDWRSIWFTFAGYAAVLSVVFPLVFKYRHDPTQAVEVRH